MILGLTKGGTYEVLKDDTDIYPIRSSYDYFVIECSSYAKGPVYTIVRSKDITQIPEELRIELTVNFVNPICGRDHIHGLKMEYDIDTYRALYSVISNLYQYDLYNAYMAEMMYELDINEEIIIEELRIFHKKDDKSHILTFHYYYDAPCNLLDKFLKSAKLNLHTNKIMKGEAYLVFDKHGMYYPSETIPEDAKYVGVYMSGSQSLYLLSYKKYKRMNRLDYTEISIGRREDRITEDCYEHVLGFGERHMCFQLMLTIPQYILLYTKLQSPDIMIFVSITIDGKEYLISADPKEIENGFSLFKIIDELTKI